MRYIRRRSTACLAGLIYLMAGALGGSLHNHAGHAHDLACSADVHGEGPPAGCSGEACQEPGSCPVPLSHDDCLACRHATQTAVVSAPQAELVPVAVEAEVCAEAPSLFVEPLETHRLARAPPLG